jgi:hypothetical protein
MGIIGKKPPYRLGDAADFVEGDSAHVTENLPVVSLDSTRIKLRMSRVPVVRISWRFQ